MSEDGKYGAHPDKVKAPDLPRGLDGKPFTGETVSHKKTNVPQGVMGMFADDAEPESTQQVGERTTQTIEAAVPKRLRFKKGTELYAVTFDSETDDIVIPRSVKQARALYRGNLEFDDDLVINNELGMEDGKKGGRVVRRVGKSDYGAFTVVDVRVTGEDGETAIEQSLASLTTRRLP